MIAILMLNTHFPRLQGDIGNPASFQQAPLYHCIEAATVAEIVTARPLDPKIINAFIRGAKQLEAAGATVIGASCGFVAAAQQQIQAAINTPFISSSLLLIPLLRAMFGDAAPIGVLTFDANKLGARHFNGVLNQNLNQKIGIYGLPRNAQWAQCIARDLPDINTEVAKAEVLAVAAQCLAAQPDTRALVLECTNFSPWKQSIKQHYGVPVFDLVEALEWLNTANARTSPRANKSLSPETNNR